MPWVWPGCVAADVIAKSATTANPPIHLLVDGGAVLFALIGVVLWGAATVFLAMCLPRMRSPGFPPGSLPWMQWMPTGFATVWGFVVIWLFSVRGRAAWRFHLGVVGRGLAGSAALATFLSAAQLLPVLEFSRQTIRAAAPVSHDIYIFSIEPFRFLELAWPNILGVHFEKNTYWRDAFDIPGFQPELWSQSLYVGGLSLMLACAELSFRRGPPWRVWLSAIVVVSLLASIGRYASPIWATRACVQALRLPMISDLTRNLGGLDLAITTPIRLDGFLRDGDGGFYWWLATVLPGFRQFRFPAKFFTLTALGIAALAGSGWDNGCARAQRRVTILVALVVFSSLAMLAGAWISRPAILETFHSSVVSSAFGPIDFGGGFRVVVQSLAQAAIVSSLGLQAVRMVGTRPLTAGAIVLMVMTADLALANARYVVTAPQASLESKPEVLRAIEDRERKSPSSGPFRVYRLPYWEPRVWQTTASSHRTVELFSWYRDTLYPKHGINLGVEYTHAFGVGGIEEFERFFRDFPVAIKTPEAARMLDVGMGRPVVYYPRRSFDIWNTRYFIIPADSYGWRQEYRGYASFLFRSERIYPNPGTPGEINVENLSKDWIDNHDVQVLRNLDELPRAWVVHDALGQVGRCVSRSSVSHAAGDSLRQ